jgi:hypothetical protein
MKPAPYSYLATIMWNGATFMDSSSYIVESDSPMTDKQIEAYLCSSVQLAPQETLKVIGLDSLKTFRVPPYRNNSHPDYNPDTGEVC